MTEPSSHVKIDADFGVVGAIDEAGLQWLGSQYKSLLYLCPDCGADFAFPSTGFEHAKTFFENARKVPMDPSSPCFKLYDQTASMIMKSYRAYELAINQMAKPCVIMCKTNRRASTVAMAYKAVKEGKTAYDMIKESTERGLKFVEMAGLANWATMVINLLSFNPKSCKVVIRQLFEKETSTYTYLVADTSTKVAVLIDPVLETAERDANYIKELGFNLKYTINTHVHADHITGSNKLKTFFPDCKSVIAAVSGAACDVAVEQFDILYFGNRHLYVFSTPGHTAGCISLVLDDNTAVFTGDALLIRGCGRTDFQQGNSDLLFDSIHTKLYTLPESCVVYPGHDYKGFLYSTIGEEKNFNLRLTKSRADYVDLMANLNLPYPKKIDASLPANMKDGALDN